MNFIKIYSDLQINPKNITLYKKLIKYYEDKNPQIANAYKRLLKEKNEFNNTSFNEKQ